MWWIWVLIAVAAVIGELVGSGLVFGGIAAAAAAAALVSVFVGGILPGAITLLVVSVLYLVSLRPIALRMLESHTSLALPGPSTARGLIGRKAIVTQDVTPHSGQVRVGDGEFWSARLYDGKETIPVGSLVEIALVEGLTALVWREEA